ncbi:hypothetical protein QBC33DRAFT_586532 [Phialemonium atrogriseum]|uniref:Glutaminase A n=1 Tax=Phialemonium atrogriseum TaxID=1093897 RepID=A0AAJ0BZH1_9PEZI|nr:uncharacterized protein QBC33DRAFT_586532 [Phialemonium atrogriseum]KAK1767360.1 hypothetical protein QBC33DRAFT_586532 [Phialemonium atrogriseum]
MFVGKLHNFALLLGTVAARDPFTNATGGHGGSAPTYSPARPPAVPLAVRSPYTSAWSTTANNSALNRASVRFWNGDPLGWEGIVTVDGVFYEYLGAGSQATPGLANISQATPESVSYDSHYSNFTFTAGPVRITASFFSPVTPNDLCRASIPLSYLTTTVESTDSQPHDVQFYSDVDLAWVSRDRNKAAVWELHGAPMTGRSGTGNNTITDSATELYSWIAGQEAPEVFGEDHDFPQWGNFSYSTSEVGIRSISAHTGSTADVRSHYLKNGRLGNFTGPNHRGWASGEAVFAYSHDVGTVLQASVRYTIGSIQTPVIKYRTSAGISALRPWWEKCYGDVYSMIKFHWHDFDAVHALANEFESQLRTDIDTYYQQDPTTARNTERPRSCSHDDDADIQPYIFDPSSAYGFLNPANFSGIAIPGVFESQSYYSIVALSARQAMGAFAYAAGPTTQADSTDDDDNNPLVFQKELSSSGNVNTVDVLFPGLPFLLWANPELLRLSLEPLLAFQEAGLYPNGYAAHDLGARWPEAVGHALGDDEAMPVEESANMILMCYAYYRFASQAPGWLDGHYALLRRWAEYLVEFALVPAAQLSTDDFAGTLANQTNLAVKGIVGLQAMSAVAAATGRAADAQWFGRTAREYYARWEALAIDPSGRHTLLSYQWRSSWGLLYNVYMDRLLGLGIVGEPVYEMQCEWYTQVSQVFGVPLDSRHHYTKSDWMMWAAATCPPGMRSMFVNAIAYWLNLTTTEDPFTDLFETLGTGYYPTSPDSIRFKARPVAGGHFSLLALLRGGLKRDDTTEGDIPE